MLKLFACLFTCSENDVDRLVAEYPNDLNRHLRDEILQMKYFLWNQKAHLKSISDLGMKSTFPERSFSSLARIKNKLRSSMSQLKLNSLALLSIESEFVKTIDFSDIVDDFTTRKARKAVVTWIVIS